MKKKINATGFVSTHLEQEQFKQQPHKIVKHTQTICWQIAADNILIYLYHKYYT